MSRVQLVQKSELLKVVFWVAVFLKEIFKLIKMYQDGKLPVDQLIKGHINLENINEAFDKLDQGDSSGYCF